MSTFGEYLLREAGKAAIQAGLILPPKGIVAGQAVADLYLRHIGWSKWDGGVRPKLAINDYDIFIPSNGNPYGATNYPSEIDRFGITKVESRYGTEFPWIPHGQKAYRIINTWRSGLINMIVYQPGEMEWEYRRAADRSGIDYKDLLASFDINVVQIGVVIETGEVVKTNAFEAFLDHGDLKVENLSTPARTMIRLCKKVEKGFRADLHSELGLLHFSIGEAFRTNPNSRVRFGDTLHRDYVAHEDIISAYIEAEVVEWKDVNGRECRYYEVKPKPVETPYRFLKKMKLGVPVVNAPENLRKMAAWSDRDRERVALLDETLRLGGMDEEKRGEFLASISLPELAWLANGSCGLLAELGKVLSTTDDELVLCGHIHGESSILALLDAMRGLPWEKIPGFAAILSRLCYDSPTEEMQAVLDRIENIANTEKILSEERFEKEGCFIAVCKGSFVAYLEPDPGGITWNAVCWNDSDGWHEIVVDFKEIETVDFLDDPVPVGECKEEESVVRITDNIDF